MTTIKIELSNFIINGNSYPRKNDYEVHVNGDSCTIIKDARAILPWVEYTEVTDGNGNVFQDVQELTAFLNMAIRLYNSNFWNDAIFEIYQKFNAVTKIQGDSVLQFGANLDIDADTEETVWRQGGIETDIVGNLIDTISSDNAGDTQTVIITGHTEDGGGLKTKVVQTATLNGQSKVVLATPLNTVEVLVNDTGTDFVGEIYVYEDDTVTGGVPSTTAKIHMRVGYNNKSTKCALTVTNGTYLIIDQISVNIRKQTAAGVDFGVRVKENGKTWIGQYLWAMNSQSGGASPILTAPLICGPNSRVRMDAISSATNTSISSTISGQVLKVEALLQQP